MPKKPNLPLSAGRMLRSARTGEGLSLREAGDRSGVPFSTIAQLERDERRPSAVDLYRLAHYYELDLEDLCRRLVTSEEARRGNG